ncbi:ABC transporter permease [Paenibacillus sp. IB182496]|uniref:ABC transporter permease n=1 Tax=Paenibacillus sabuli TaxID=2772509 RepID=A0A927BPE0_9BACL|nr:ABC transporter permease [Paenibacillus sabuli]MBD2844271.1 ABC transporter permease [Paenibacillus sabuli]
MRILDKFGFAAIAVFLLLAVWQLAVLVGDYEASLLPAPADVGGAIAELLQSGALWTHLRVSLLRFAAGYVAAALAGVGLGLLFSRVPWLWRIADPLVQVIRPVSPIAWSPFIVLWFGIGNAPAIVIIFLAGFFPVLLSTVAGVRGVDPIYLKVAGNFGIAGHALLTRIILPAAFPSITAGMRIAIGTAWIFLVSGEMVGSQSGLGYLIVDSRNTIRLDLVMAGIVFIGLCGLALDRAVLLFERRVRRRWGASG